MESPISYPTISINGVAHVVRFNNIAFYRLDKQGVDLRTVKERLTSGTCAFSLIYDLLAACIGGYTGEQLAGLVTPAAASQAVIDAMGKVQPPAEVALREPAAQSNLQ